MSTKKNKRRAKNTLPTSLDIFRGMRSEVAQVAIFHTGGGSHADKRDKKSRKAEWTHEEW